MATVSSSTSSSADLLSSAYTATTTSTAASNAAASVSSSDIDWSGLIEGAVAAKLSKADSIDTKISANEAKISAYQEMQGLLSDLSTASNALRGATGSSSSSTDVFQSRAAYVSANGSVDAASSLAATVAAGTEPGSYDVQILQLAKAHKVAGSELASRSDDLGKNGVISLSVEGGQAATVTITDTMSLIDIAGEINASSVTSGVKATVLKISDTAYQLVLSASDTGKAISASTVSGDDVLSTIGITDATAAFANVLQAPQDAVVKLDGIQVTRDSNDIDDLITGVTLHLYQATQTDPSAANPPSITLEVGADVSGAKTAIQDFVTAYNAIQTFITTQQGLTSSGTAASDAVLFGDGTMRNIATSLQKALTTTIGGESMALLGLSLGTDGSLTLDETTLDSALLENLDAVTQLLSFKMTTSSNDLQLLARGSTVPAPFKLDVQVDSSGTLTGAKVNGDASLFTVKGSRIVGNAGTAYEGYSFVFSGKSSTSIDVSMSAGLAELVYTRASSAANTSGGSLQIVIDNLTTTDTALQTKSDDIRAAAETYRTNLTNRYARYQAAIESANATLDYLTALLDQENS